MIEHQPLEDKGSEELEELLHYINGTDNQKEEQEDKQLSAKAAKRARQKQRKVRSIRNFLSAVFLFSEIECLLCVLKKIFFSFLESVYISSDPIA